MAAGCSLAKRVRLYKCKRLTHHATWCTNSVGVVVRIKYVYVNSIELVDPLCNSGEFYTWPKCDTFQFV